MSSDEEESIDALSDPESDVEQDADSDDHAAVRVLEQDGEFTLSRAWGRGRGRAANRLGRQLAGRRGAPGAARVARAANRGVLRGVARGGRRCRGRGRGVQPAPGVEYKTWEEEDDHVPPVFKFEPQREAGFHFPEDFAPVCELDFFELFFSDEVIQTIADHTNDYADMHILGKLAYAQPDGSWHPTSSEEIRKFVGFLLYRDWCVWGAMSSTGVQPVCTMVSGAELFLQGSGSRLCLHFCAWTPPTMTLQIVSTKFVLSMTKSVPPPHNSGSRSSTFR